MNNTYPVLSAKDALTIGQAVESHAGRAFDDQPYKNLIKSRPCKEAFDERLLREIARDFQLQRTAIMGAGGNLSAKKNEQEEEFAQLAVRIARVFPVEALQDPDFWRYLSVFHFRDYIMAIEGDFEPQRFGGLGNRGMVRWTLIRGLVWGLHSSEGEDLSGVYKARLAREAAGKGSGVRDLYISIVVRMNWARFPGAGKAYIDAVIAEPGLFDVGKKFRPSHQLNVRIRRVSNNIYFPGLDKHELETLMLQERVGIPSEPALSEVED